MINSIRLTLNLWSLMTTWNKMRRKQSFMAWILIKIIQRCRVYLYFIVNIIFVPLSLIFPLLTTTYIDVIMFCFGYLLYFLWISHCYIVGYMILWIISWFDILLFIDVYILLTFIDYFQWVWIFDYSMSFKENK